MGKERKKEKGSLQLGNEFEERFSVPDKHGRVVLVKGYASVTTEEYNN